MTDLTAADVPLILDFTPSGTSAVCRVCSYRTSPAATATVTREAIDHYITEHLTENQITA